MHKCSKPATSPSAHFLGADQETLLHLYRSLIWSKLDYGCVVYGSSRSSYLRMLDPIQNHALRLCLGAYRTSPTSSLCVEANEPPLYFRRKKLSLQYCLKLSCNCNNPAFLLFSILNSNLYLKENPLTYRLLQSVFQAICKCWFQEEWCYYIFYTNHTALAFNSPCC